MYIHYFVQVWDFVPCIKRKTYTVLLQTKLRSYGLKEQEARGSRAKSYKMEAHNTHQMVTNPKRIRWAGHVAQLLFTGCIAQGVPYTAAIVLPHLSYRSCFTHHSSLAVTKKKTPSSKAEKT
jgi:hypothetical protein